MTRGPGLELARDAGDRSGGGAAFTAEAPIELPKRRFPVAKVAAAPDPASNVVLPRLLGIACVCVAAAATVASLGTVMRSPWPGDQISIEGEKPFSLTGAWRDMTRAIEVRNGWKGTSPAPPKSLEDIMPAPSLEVPRTSTAPAQSTRDEAMEVALRHAQAAAAEEARISVAPVVTVTPAEALNPADTTPAISQPQAPEVQPSEVATASPLLLPDIPARSPQDLTGANWTLASVAEILSALPQIVRTTSIETWPVLLAFPLHPAAAVESEPAEPAPAKSGSKSEATAASEQPKAKPRPKPKSTQPVSGGTSASNTSPADTQVQDKP